ncbi:MAG: amino acid racemase [Candidatus Woesearchaeota archaeon]
MAIANGCNSIGIVGGLGPRTTADFYVDLTDAFRKHGVSPRITIDNVAFPLRLEEEIIKHSRNERLLLPYLKASVRRLNLAGVDAIVMPCNTAHFFIDHLRKVSDAPIISIVEETARVIRKRGLKKVGILSSSKTLNSLMYQKKLLEEHISVLIPSREYQLDVSEFILSLLSGKMDEKAKKRICCLVEEMKARGAEAVVFACTDLRLGLQKNDIPLPVVDSYEALLNSAIRALKKKHF